MSVFRCAAGRPKEFLSVIVRLSIRCRADSAVECLLMLDYLPYYCLPLSSLTLTLAYVGLCSLLSNLFTVDILPSSEE